MNENDLAIKLSEQELKSLYEARKKSEECFQQEALKLWRSRGHPAPDNSAFIAQRQEHWEQWMLRKKAN